MPSNIQGSPLPSSSIATSSKNAQRSPKSLSNSVRGIGRCLVSYLVKNVVLRVAAPSEGCSQLSLLQKRPCHRRRQVSKMIPQPLVPDTGSRPKYSLLHTKLQILSVIEESSKIMISNIRLNIPDHTLVKPIRRPVSATSSAESSRPKESRGYKSRLCVITCFMLKIYLKIGRGVPTLHLNIDIIRPVCFCISAAATK